MTNNANARTRKAPWFVGALLISFSFPINAQSPVEVVKLTAGPNEVGNAFFGWSSDVDGDTAVVGAYREPTDGFSRAGAAYVFRNDGAGNWTREARLTAIDEFGNFDGGNNDRFGQRVAIDGDTLVVGAYFDDDAGTNAGSAYVFVRTGTTWSFQQKLLASDGTDNDRFSVGMAISGDTLFIGSPNDAYDIDGDMVEEGFAGSVYHFTRSAGIWTEQGKLNPGDAEAGQNFGARLSLSGDSLLISASGDDEVAVDAGAGYVFTKQGSNWVEEAKLTTAESDPGDRTGFGALSGDTAILGAPNGITTSTTGNKAYVFVRDNGVWTQQATLTGSDPNPGNFFGPNDIFGDIAVVGADADDENGVASGVAYVFKRTGTVWAETAKFFATDTKAYDWFGGGISMSGDTILIAAPSSAFVFDGSPGAAYIFDLQSGETETGSDVAVEPVPVDEDGNPVEDAPAVALEFDNVVDGGETTVTLTDPSTQDLPDGFKLTGLSGGATYFDIETEAMFDGFVEICIDYSTLAVAGNPSKLKFMHYDEVAGVWENITSSNDTVNMILCGITDAFSLFAIAEIDDPVAVLADLVDLVSTINANNGISNALDSKLSTAEQALADANLNNDTAALQVLMNAFIESVEAQRGKQISEAEADALVTKAQEIAQIL